MCVPERVDALRRLIAQVELRQTGEFTHNEPMKERIAQYKKWLAQEEADHAVQCRPVE